MVDSIAEEEANVHGGAFIGELPVPIDLRRKWQEPILYQREQELVKPTDNNKTQKLRLFFLSSEHRKLNMSESVL